MITERHAEFEARIDAVAIDLPEIVIHPARAQHWSGDSGADRQFGGKFSDALRPRDQDFVRDNQVFELIEELWKGIDDLLRPCEPVRTSIDAATAEAHVVAHHP